MKKKPLIDGKEVPFDPEGQYIESSHVGHGYRDNMISHFAFLLIFLILDGAITIFMNQALPLSLYNSLVFFSVCALPSVLIFSLLFIQDYRRRKNMLVIDAKGVTIVEKDETSQYDWEHIRDFDIKLLGKTCSTYILLTSGIQRYIDIVPTRNSDKLLALRFYHAVYWQEKDPSAYIRQEIRRNSEKKQSEKRGCMTLICLVVIFMLLVLLASLLD